MDKIVTLKMSIILSFALFIPIFASHLVSADGLNQTVCCEKTISGLYCQNVPQNQCNPSAREAPTACESTSYCSPGVCYNSVQGTCLDNTPQITCNANGGLWSAQSPPQCNLGCCILGDQAAFVTLTRCKYLSSSLGLQTNYNPSITSETACVQQVQNQDQGACVYTSNDLQMTCKFTTRDQCNLGFNDTNSGTKSEFYKDKLCTDPQLGTNCAPTTKTACVPGKDGVYFIDTCGNPANIYDASKINDQGYWTDVKTLSESCNPGSGNANSAICGNCNYLQGSICRQTSSNTAKANYGNYICQDLNCEKTSDGKSYKQGESWCVYNDQGTSGQGNDAVGSRFYKHICINGQEVLEQCDDFRQQVCIQGSIQTSAGAFSEAACRVNRWQDCTAQTNRQDCENTDKRDCIWQNGAGFNDTSSACIPKDSPGLQFWTGSDAQSVCAQANAQCIVTFEKGLFGGESCKSNCQCLTADWQKQRIQLCQALGDCGPKINYIGQKGYSSGYNQTITGT